MSILFSCNGIIYPQFLVILYCMEIWTCHCNSLLMSRKLSCTGEKDKEIVPSHSTSCLVRISRSGKESGSRNEWSLLGLHSKVSWSWCWPTHEWSCSVRFFYRTLWPKGKWHFLNYYSYSPKMDLLFLYMSILDAIAYFHIFLSHSQINSCFSVHRILPPPHPPPPTWSSQALMKSGA